MNWPEVRAQFPVFDEHVYLNAGTFGPLRRSALDAMSTLREWEGVSGRGGRAYFDEMLTRRDRVRALLAAQIRVPADRVSLTESTTQGVHVVLSGLALGPEDEVATTDAEHFGLTGPLLAAGVKLRIARVNGLPAEQIFDAVRSQVSARTRLIAISAVSWLDGTVFPWRELRAATGVPVLVDGAQSAGALDVDATEADYYTVSAQKWLCGPDATGALAVREPEALPPRLVSYPSQAAYDIAAGTWEPKPGAARFDPVFTPAASLAGLEAALVDLPAGRFERARELTEQCRERLVAAGHDVVTQPGQATLISFRARGGGDPAEIAAALYKRGVIMRELPGTVMLRASVGWWNDESDLERLLEGLAAVSSRLVS
jgi:L-cysteine/cystine lyase